VEKRFGEVASRKEQAVVDRRRENRAVACVAAGERMRIGTTREGVMRPAGFHERLQLAAEIVAEKRDDLIDACSDDGAFAGVFELFRIAAPKDRSSERECRSRRVAHHQAA